MSLWGKKNEPTPSQPLSRPIVDAVELSVSREGEPLMSTSTKGEEAFKNPLPKKSPPLQRDTPSTKEMLGVQTQDQVEDIILSRFGKARSALGPGTIVQGKLAFDTPVRIDGELSGELSSSKVIVVGTTGRIVDAEVKAADLVVFGHVKGNISVSGKLEILGNGVVEGVIETAQLVVDGQGCLIGSCRMGKFRAHSLYQEMTVTEGLSAPLVPETVPLKEQEGLPQDGINTQEVSSQRVSEGEVLTESPAPL